MTKEYSAACSGPPERSSPTGTYQISPDERETYPLKGGRYPQLSLFQLSPIWASVSWSYHSPQVCSMLPDYLLAHWGLIWWFKVMQSAIGLHDLVVKPVPLKIWWEAGGFIGEEFGQVICFHDVSHEIAHIGPGSGEKSLHLLHFIDFQVDQPKIAPVLFAVSKFYVRFSAFCHSMWGRSLSVCTPSIPFLVYMIEHGYCNRDTIRGFITVI